MIRQFAIWPLMAVSLANPATAQTQNFNRVGTFHVVDNLTAGENKEKSTVAEIISATADGKLLIYTDSPGNRLGFINLDDPSKPTPAGALPLGGEPTSVVVSGKTALVAVVSSRNFKEPSGHIAAIDLDSRKQVLTCDVGGQPDSLTISPDGTYLAVAIENERDEKLNKGELPQLPAGNLTIFSLKNGALDCSTRRVVDLTGLAAVAPEDPEPEFVDINSRNEAVVTLQENNHIVIVDLASGKVTAHFSAGTVDLSDIDTKRDGVIDLSSAMKAVPREPDAVRWLDDDRFVTADEGDWKGGSRTFTIFRRDGSVAYSSGSTLDHLAVRLGHYNDKRNTKGVEPEGIAVGRYGAERLIFVGLERASLVAIYQDTGGEPKFLQALPGGVGPEGLLALPQRNLLIAAAESDNRKSGGIGSIVTIYQRTESAASYPMLQSANDASGKPIAFGALSGLAAHPSEAGKLFAVTDSIYNTARILTLDATVKPARIVSAITVTKDGKPAANLDIEGIAALPDGGYWLASEGNPEREKDKTQSSLVRVNAKGEIEQSVALPDSLAAQANRFGFEGIAITGTGADQTLWIAVQREWKDDPKGFARLLTYVPATGTWGQLRYPLDPPTSGWVGLSEITAVPGGFIVIERDNLTGPEARNKQLTFVPAGGLKPVALDAKEVPVVSKIKLRDLIPDLLKGNGYVHDKVEGFAFDKNGDAFFVTDNDGVDGTSGETVFLNLGRLALPTR
ncbi:Phytase-like domain containing protein [Rhabdaerophilaceae bacterium]